MQGVGPGSVLGGRYAVTLRTFAAARHERWRATDRTLEREVVLVCFAAGSAMAAAALDAARRASGVEDPRLVRVLDVGTDHNISFIVEEPLTGGVSMNDLLGSGVLPAQEVRRLVGESASALDKARQRGLHHLALTPDSVVRLPDGAVKVRGIATEAALVDAAPADTLSGERASRLDAIGLVKLVYAGLTARWPADSPGPAGYHGADLRVALDPAPTIVGGVAPASEIVSGVPNDLDLICRMTLTDDRGPLSPGELALQIAPWPPSPPEYDRGTGVGLTQTSPSVTTTRRLPGLSRNRRPDEGARPTEAPVPTEPAAASSSEAATAAPAVSSGAGRGAGIAAAGAAAAGAAGAFGDRVGSFARAAADKASAKAAERRAAHADDDLAEDIHLDDALDDAPPTRLEPAAPLLGREAPEAPSKAASRIALAIIGVLVVLVGLIGIKNVMKIGQPDAPVAAGQTVTVRGTRPPTTPSTPTTKAAPTTTAPSVALAAVSITGGTGFDPQDDKTEADQKVKLVYDGDLSTGWESRWYGTPKYNGKKDGVGVQLDLSRSVVVQQVELVLPAKQDVTVYAATKADLDGAQKIGSVTGKEGTITLTAPQGLKAATMLLVWVTKAAPAEAPNHYRAQISEVTVR